MSEDTDGFLRGFAAGTHETMLMDDIRAALAITLFGISSYLVYDLFANGFSWLVLAALLAGYLLAHFIWPRKDNSEESWYDILEVFIDLPYRSIALFIRSIGRLWSRADADVDLDL